MKCTYMTHMDSPDVKCGIKAVSFWVDNRPPFLRYALCHRHNTLSDLWQYDKVREISEDEAFVLMVMNS